MDPELGQEVAVEGIHTALRQLWAQDEARTNACLINFAVYSEQPGSLRKNSEIVRVLTREHACRALLIEMDRGATLASIRAWITAHCHLSEGRKSVCCEQISFALTGVSRGRLRNTVFAHLSSDLPLILWWQGELSPIFEERLYSVIDRFVFDSADWENPSESFRLVDQAISSGSRPLVIQDLAWTRSYHFRLAVASLFDDPLALTPCHLNVIPTRSWVPDWRILLRNPREGLQLVNTLEESAWSCVASQFLSDATWCQKMLKTGRPAYPEILRHHIVCGCNFPPSQFQLHIQYFLLPWIPGQYKMMMDGHHLPAGRWFPLEYIKRVLALNDPMAVTMDTPLSAIFDK